MKKEKIDFRERRDPEDKHPYWDAHDSEGRFVAQIIRAREPNLIFPDRAWAVWNPDSSVELGEFNTKHAAFDFVRSNTADGRCSADPSFRSQEKKRYVIRMAFDNLQSVHAVAVANRWPGLEAKLQDAFAELEEIAEQELGS